MKKMLLALMLLALTLVPGCELREVDDTAAKQRFHEARMDFLCINNVEYAVYDHGRGVAMTVLYNYNGSVKQCGWEEL